ncbi:hypothetical protein L6452_02969 [Arctium lappa]|uniref:Uncharacterized protein n=3 Tax=Arctium lappa TaxID=4217 RepID=A0ACB9FLE8_ARCLA|nr:hypothetical protein L6452_02965 [Arctium lappa]KAI3771799.1 hypothetical protein L6452_02967 [Arctium lappa]KAI3771801.1 hypothetical protein L6452_02969 [Arctium lappa]
MSLSSHESNIVSIVKKHIHNVNLLFSSMSHGSHLGCHACLWRILYWENKHFSVRLVLASNIVQHASSFDGVETSPPNKALYAYLSAS